MQHHVNEFVYYSVMFLRFAVFFQLVTLVAFFTSKRERTFRVYLKYSGRVVFLGITAYIIMTVMSAVFYSTYTK